jgi:Fe2+ or Zn2+ uptake regulation protein
MINEIKTKLVANGINPSYHRIRIYEYMLKNRVHPSVDRIYSSLVSEIPSLSRTTVYNTLKNFAEKGLVLLLTINENEMRFDGYTHNHAHFLCLNCSEIYDIDMPNADYCAEAVATPHKITETQVYFRGICETCQKKQS